VHPFFEQTIHLATGTYFLYNCSEQLCQPTDVQEVIETEWIPLHKLKTLSVNIDVNTFIRKHSDLLINKAQRNLPSYNIRKLNYE
jgi:hypothetical protein